MDTDRGGCRIKICGLSRIKDIEAVNRAQPDFAGFVFAESRRQVGGSWAAVLRRALDPRIRAVGVFVNAPPEDILRLADNGTIQMIQLHGDEDGNYIEALKRRVEAPVIKAVRVCRASDILKAEALPCDYLLLDTYAGGQYGGSGRTFDWGMIPPLRKPYFLAGGICEENAARAISYGPYALDVSSAVETGGKKDPEKICRMVLAVRETAE